MVLLYSEKLPIGFKAPNFSLPGVDGNTYSLSEILGKKGLVVIFTCNHCPYAKTSWPILIKLAKEFKDKGIQFVAINANDEKQYPEDSFEKMKKKTLEWGINFPYLRDQTQRTAKAYKAQCTPDIYVFDENQKLFYHGRINDSWQDEKKATKEDLKEALKALLSGKKPPVEQFPSMGCSIKWKTAIKTK